MPNKGMTVVHDLRKLPDTRTPQLPNKRQELFCRFVAEGSTYVDAYELAGYTKSSANASTLANRPEIKDRIAELRNEAIERQEEFERQLAEADRDHLDPDGSRKLVAIYTADDVRRLIAENARLAQIAGEFKAANEALKMLADSFGMFTSPTSGKESGKSSGAQVSIALINQALGEAEGGGGDVRPARKNPLAPSVQ